MSFHLKTKELRRYTYSLMINGAMTEESTARYAHHRAIITHIFLQINIYLTCEFAAASNDCRLSTGIFYVFRFLCVFPISLSTLSMTTVI